ncbi:MAG: kelch repeat-containing protein, partial [Planctomycetota bacterium]
SWSAFAERGPPAERFEPYYQAAYHPGTRTVYCLSGGPVLYAFRLDDRSWKRFPPAAELEGLSWHALACDPERGRLVAIGADKKAGATGWTRAVVYDIASGTWTRLETETEEGRRARREFETLGEALWDFAGRARLAFFRDPAGVGEEAELVELSSRAERLRALPRAGGFAGEVDRLGALVRERKTLEALREARSLIRAVEDAAERASCVPRARRNSPLAFDPPSRRFVLFGGDHEDYLLADTWILDAEAGRWERRSPPLAPSPRAGHALFPLPRAGGVALYEGYEQSANTDYGAPPYRLIDPAQLWRYDVLADRWGLLGAWPHSQEDEPSNPPPVGHFHGYESQWYSPPAIAADSEDRILFAAHPGRVWFLPWREIPARTWMLPAAELEPDPSLGAALGRPPGERRCRGGPFVAAYGEVEDAPEPSPLEDLPPNRWVRLPEAPRNPCQGCRQRDWGTVAWDPDRDQILMWGGGHCVRSASVVAHWSPRSGRIVEGYDADEPYSANGGGGFDSSVLNRPWVSAHNYHHYAYDPRARLLVSARGYLYDPERMDWLRIEPYPAPFVFDWAHTVVEGSRRGAVAWARKKGPDGRPAEEFGLWLFDREKGWIDLEPRGELFGPYCDAHGMVYDPRRDRMVLAGVGGGYEKLSDGSFLAFDFASRTLEPLVPERRELARTHNARELVYATHADWIVIGELHGKDREGRGKGFTRVYDCAANRMSLLDAGDVPDGHSTGWVYDERRKLVYVFTYRGEVWALRPDPGSARLREG